jgi:hypothetical protein
MSGVGLLKLKKPIGGIDKKQKKKNTEARKELEEKQAELKADEAAERKPVDNRTKSEKAFEEAQAKRACYPTKSFNAFSFLHFSSMYILCGILIPGTRNHRKEDC